MNNTDIVLDMIRIAALNGKVCPTNKEFGVALGNFSAGSTAVEKLKHLKIIESVRAGSHRIITIADSGLTTAFPPPPKVPVDKGRRKISSRQAGSLTTRIRSYVGSIKPLSTGPSPKTCRFISNDDMKNPDWCGKRISRGPYCRKHWKLCHKVVS